MNMTYKLCIYPISDDLAHPDLEVEVTLDEDTLALILNEDLPLYACYPLARDMAQRLLQYELVTYKIEEDQEAFVEVFRR